MNWELILYPLIFAQFTEYMLRILLYMISVYLSYINQRNSDSYYYIMIVYNNKNLNFIFLDKKLKIDLNKIKSI